MHFLALTAAQHEELAADGWSFEHRLVGECTRRLFRNGDPSVVDGRLVAFLEASGEEAPLWKNMHEDGELEDLEFHEVKTARLNYRLKLAQPRGGVFAEDVSDFSIDEHLLSGPNGSTARRGPGISEPPPDSKETKALVAQRLAKEKASLEKGGFLLRESANFVWYPHLNCFVGWRTRRFFRFQPNEPVDGRIVAFTPPQGDEPAFFKNLHDDDGQMEDLEEVEMRAAHRHFKFGVKQLGSFGAMGFYHAQFADDLSDGEYDGYPEEDGKPDLDLCKMTCANMVRYVLEKEGDVAAVIAEPARAVPYIPPPGFWAAVRQACDDVGAMLIFDEIPTGLGKTGRMFACDHDGVVPDLLVMGKGLGGGILPIAAVMARPGLDVAGDYAFGHYTHEKNPVTTRAALTTIEIIEDEGLVENAATVGAHALARLHDMKDRLDVIGDVRGRGFLLGVEIVTDKASKEPAAELAEDILYRCLDGGLSFKISMGNTLTLTPPLVVTQYQMDHALDILESAIDEAARSRGLI